MNIITVAESVIGERERANLVVPLSGFFYIIRESVDSLYRDDTGEIRRDPHTKRLKTQRESLPRPSKHTSNSLRAHVYMYLMYKAT